jgi:hypothetical protein
MMTDIDFNKHKYYIDMLPKLVKENSEYKDTRYKEISK